MAGQVITPFGKKLEERISEVGLSSAEFCRRAKMPPPQLIRLKQSKKPHKVTLERISKVLSVPVDYWFPDEAPAKVRVYLIVEINGKEYRYQLPARRN